MNYIKNCIILTLLLLASTTASVIAKTSEKGEFGVKGFYVDCRAQVIKMSAMKELALDLSKKGINTMLVEWEATYPFEKHGTLNNEFTYTRAEVKDFIAYCTELNIDVIPLQNCFGHCEYILRHNRYHNLREDDKDIAMVCPLKMDLATPIFREIFEEVVELHPSQYFHIGADETRLLGSCEECSKVMNEHGKSRLFVDYINAMTEIVLEMGKTPIIWADIILKYPESVTELSKDLIFVDWNYGWDINRFGDLQHLFDAGVKLWGASALRSGPDNMYITQWMKHFGNLTDFIPHSRKSNYKGMINTSWSTSGMYGYHYDSYWEILEMQPMRQVYPTQAFNILLEAYAVSVNNREPLDADKFILNYAQERFGVPKTEAYKLLNYMKMPQEMMGRYGKDKKGVAIEDIVEQAVALREEFATFKPKQNKDEYKHLCLMLDIRINYLRYKEVESTYDSKSYKNEDAPTLFATIKDIYKESKGLEKRFVAMNREYLKDGQWEGINDSWNEKMSELYRRLKRNSENL